MPDGEAQQAAQRLWDEAAVSFDDAPDHGLRDPAVREAWTALLRTWLPAGPGEVLDIGCGTGSLSVVMAGLGHRVTGIDLSPAMIARAEAKAAAAGFSIPFHVMDAAVPALAPRQYDAIVCRHLLWALPEPMQVLKRWVELLAPGGRLILVEGYWHTGSGLHSAEVCALLPPSLTLVSVQDLSPQSDCWGGEVADERYAAIADRVRDAPAIPST